MLYIVPKWDFQMLLYYITIAGLVISTGVPTMTNIDDDIFQNGVQIDALSISLICYLIKEATLHAKKKCYKCLYLQKICING